MALSLLVHGDTFQAHSSGGGMHHERERKRRTPQAALNSAYSLLGL